MKKLFFLILLIPLFSFSQNDYISNKDYNEFVTYVGDSITRKRLGEEVDEAKYLVFTDNNHNDINPPLINWKAKIKWKHGDVRESLYPFYGDYYNTGKREFSHNKLIHNKINIYPDVFIWLKDTSINKIWARFLVKNYFTHSYFDDYPAYGLSKEQVKEYLKWKYPKEERNYKSTNKKEILLTLPKEKFEFTVGDYYKFYQHTRDSIVRRILGEEIDEEKYLDVINDYGEDIDPPYLNWKVKIDWNDDEIILVLKSYNVITSENKINNSKINYIYYWIDFWNTKPNGKFLRKESTLIYNKHYMPEFSSINLKQELKNKTIIDFEKVDINQIIAFYNWKQENSQNKDIYSGFMLNGDDVDLLRKEKNLDRSFLNFSYTIPVITVE